MNAALIVELVETLLALAKKHGATRAVVLAAVEAHWPATVDKDDVAAAVKAGLAGTKPP